MGAELRPGPVTWAAGGSAGPAVQLAIIGPHVNGDAIAGADALAAPILTTLYP